MEGRGGGYLPARKVGRHGGAVDAVYHEALAGEEQVGQWGARGEDGHQMI